VESELVFWRRGRFAGVDATVGKTRNSLVERERNATGNMAFIITYRKDKEECIHSLRDTQSALKERIERTNV